jgi:hypothetical protein
MPLTPVKIHQTSIEQVRNRLAVDGACWLTGFNAASQDPLLEWAERLGSWDLGIAEELLGPRIMHLRYDPEKIDLADQPAYFTSDDFPLHTDVSYVPNPPGLMLMHCIRPDPWGGGQVLLAPCDGAQRMLPDEVMATLQQPLFRFRYPPACPVGSSAPAAILERGRWRFKFACMEFAAEHAPAVNAFYQALLAVCETVMLQAGDLLIVDNHRIAHGRSAFNASGAGAEELPTGRHMKRCYVNAST